MFKHIRLFNSVFISRAAMSKNSDKNEGGLKKKKGSYLNCTLYI
jgi:hypothetical protein